MRALWTGNITNWLSGRAWDDGSIGTPRSGLCIVTECCLIVVVREALEAGAMPYRGSSLRPVAVGREVREGVSHLQGSADRAEAEVGWGAISVVRASWYARGVDHGLCLRGLWCRCAMAAGASEAQAHAGRGRRYGQSGYGN